MAVRVQIRVVLGAMAYGDGAARCVCGAGESQGPEAAAAGTVFERATMRWQHLDFGGGRRSGGHARCQSVE